MGALFYVGPAYESSMSDIRRLYPNLNVSHNILTDARFLECADWMDSSDDVMAQYYYRNEERWRRANLTLFLNTVAAQIMRGSLSFLLRSNVSLIAVDGFSPQTDYNSILNEIDKETRAAENDGGGKFNNKSYQRWQLQGGSSQCMTSVSVPGHPSLLTKQTPKEEAGHHGPCATDNLTPSCGVQ
ncbi:hypothetical protein RvY_18217 [Ramazzottius varieornatus]|uniref:Uncharacterized protein n=1 Tax=Ramazzottius varieornatus TaxID=947166 RepID=A0A1D1WA32_RAMVA|nr:hypothetical protein RvY_18217 [Ramazzottius varieornatus]